METAAHRKYVSASRSRDAASWYQPQAALSLGAGHPKPGGAIRPFVSCHCVPH